MVADWVDAVIYTHEFGQPPTGFAALNVAYDGTTKPVPPSSPPSWRTPRRPRRRRTPRGTRLARGADSEPRRRRAQPPGDVRHGRRRRLDLRVVGERLARDGARALSGGGRRPEGAAARE